MAGTQKMAQQSAFEVGQNDTISMIYPMERLLTLREGIEQMNKVFNKSASVKFSDAWQVEREKIETQIATANDIQKDGAAENSEPETPAQENNGGGENDA